MIAATRTSGVVGASAPRGFWRGKTVRKTILATVTLAFSLAVASLAFSLPAVSGANTQGCTHVSCPWVAIDDTKESRGLTIAAVADPPGTIPDNSGAGGIIILTGKISDGDDARFVAMARTEEKKINPGTSVAVMIGSPGGNVFAAIKIGEWIHAHRYLTIASGECVSACALVWAAGAKRTIQPHSLVAFHSAYVVGDESHADGTGNAMVGAYLREIGYGIEDIARMIGHDPGDFDGDINDTPEMSPWVR
jgi:hypothetical protein